MTLSIKSLYVTDSINDTRHDNVKQFRRAPLSFVTFYLLFIVMLNSVMLGVVTLNVAMLGVVIVNVVTPILYLRYVSCCIAAQICN